MKKTKERRFRQADPQSAQAPPRPPSFQYKKMAEKKDLVPVCKGKEQQNLKSKGRGEGGILNKGDDDHERCRGS